jgi:ParB/RepB/Spo0J family partition protein
MTSGQFASFPITDIWVDRTKRQRRDLENIPDLAASILRSGLIHPPVIKRDGELIAGERRWTACQSLGWTAIPVQFTDQLDEIELHLIEFEENVRRTDLTWQDQCLAVKNYHEMRKKVDPEWNQERTSEALGMLSKDVTYRVAVATEIEKGNERVIAAPVYSTARGIVERDTARRKASIVIDLDEPRLAGEGPTQVRNVPLRHVDFLEWLDTNDTLFNFLHCDFPYGVGMHKSDQGAGASFGTYSDSADIYWQLLAAFTKKQDQFVAESAHLMFWFSMDYYHDTKTILEAAGWRINPFPLIWVKSDNTGILPDAARGPRRIYETAFFGSRGDRQIVSSVSNAFSAAGGNKEIHMNEKPVAMLQHFMRMFVDEYSLVLDPTAGSGNALKAAQALRANHVLGLERDQEFFNRATEVYYADL